MRHLVRPLFLLLPLSCASVPPAAPARVLPPATCTACPAGTGLLPFTEQLRVREAWLEQRHARLLPLLRKHGVGMWIVVNEEFHDDPLTPFVAPPRPYAGGRDIFVFVDAGEAGLKKHAVVGYAEEHLTRFFESPAEPQQQAQALAALDARYRPRTIALSIGGRRGPTRSLTHDSYRFLLEALGSGAEARFIPAEPLIEEYLDTRLPEEAPHYARLVALTEELVRRALSNEVVVPGTTRVGEVRRWLYDALWQRGLTTWFQPDLRVQRAGMAGPSSRGFLAVAPESLVIERGDVLHVDFGVSDMGLHSDWQRMAYVLREGEEDVPAGLKAALANTRALQQAFLAAGRPGRTSAQVYEEVMAAMAQQGITAQVYSHPLGNHGHGLGPSVDFRAARRGEAPRTLRDGSYLAMELNTLTPVPEWGGQGLYVMQEDPVRLTAEGWVPFRPLQEAFYLVH